MADGMGKRVGEHQASPATMLDAVPGLDTRRRSGWPRRQLSGRVAGLFWLLRLYVVGMLAVIAVQLARLV